jgi:hypothetical protein
MTIFCNGRVATDEDLVRYARKHIELMGYCAINPGCEDGIVMEVRDD